MATLWARFIGAQDNKDLYIIRPDVNRGRPTLTNEAISQGGQGDTPLPPDDTEMVDEGDRYMMWPEEIAPGESVSGPEETDYREDEPVSWLYVIVHGITFFLLGGIVSAYLAVGAIYFKPIEASAESLTLENLEKKRSGLFDLMKLAADDDKNVTLWRERANVELSDFESDLETVFRKRIGSGTSAASNLTDPIWTIYGSTVYCASVITSIGWGNIVPKTNTGRISCVVYAIFGIPLLFSFTSLLSNLLNLIVEKIWGFVSRMLKKTKKKKITEGSDINQSKYGNATLNKMSSLGSSEYVCWEEINFMKRDKGFQSDMHGRGDGLWTDTNESKMKNDSRYFLSLKSTIDFMINAVDYPSVKSLTRPHYNITRKDVPLLIQYLSILNDVQIEKCMQYASIDATDSVLTWSPETETSSKSEECSFIKANRSSFHSNKAVCFPGSAFKTSGSSLSNCSSSDESHYGLLIDRLEVSDSEVKDTVQTFLHNLPLTTPSLNPDSANKTFHKDGEENGVRTTICNQGARWLSPSHSSTSIESASSIHSYFPTHLHSGDLDCATGEILRGSDHQYGSCGAFYSMDDSMHGESSHAHYAAYLPHQTYQSKTERGASHLKDDENDTNFTCNRVSVHQVDLYTRHRSQHISQKCEKVNVDVEVHQTESPNNHRYRHYPYRNYPSSNFAGDGFFSEHLDRKGIVDCDERPRRHEYLKANEERIQFQEYFPQKRMETQNKQAEAAKDSPWKEHGHRGIDERFRETAKPSPNDFSIHGTSTNAFLRPSPNHPLEQEQWSTRTRKSMQCYDDNEGTYKGDKFKHYPYKNCPSIDLTGNDIFGDHTGISEIDYYDERTRGYEYLKRDEERGQFQEYVPQKRMETRIKQQEANLDRPWNGSFRGRIDEKTWEITRPSQKKFPTRSRPSNDSLRPSPNHPSEGENWSMTTRSSMRYGDSENANHPSEGENWSMTSRSSMRYEDSENANHPSEGENWSMTSRSSMRYGDSENANHPSEGQNWSMTSRSSMRYEDSENAKNRRSFKYYPYNDCPSNNLTGNGIFDEHINFTEVVDFEEEPRDYHNLKSNEEGIKFSELENPSKVSGGRRIGEKIWEVAKPSQTDFSIRRTLTNPSFNSLFNDPPEDENWLTTTRNSMPYDDYVCIENKNALTFYSSDVENADWSQDNYDSFSQNAENKERELLNINLNAAADTKTTRSVSTSTLSHVSESEDAARNVPFIVYLFIAVVDIIIGMFIFKHLSINKTLVDGLYFTIVMLTTIGFGDILPGINDYVVLVFYGFLGLALANFVTNQVIESILDIIDSINSLGESLERDDEGED